MTVYKTIGNSNSESVEEIEKSIERINKKLVKNPKDHWNYHRRAMQREALGYYDLAVEDYDKAIEYCREDKSCVDGISADHLSRNTLLCMMGKYSEAIKNYEELIDLYDDLEYPNAYLHYHLGLAKYYSNNYNNDEILKHFDIAVKEEVFGTCETDLYYHRGLVRYYSHAYSETDVLSDFDKAIDCLPKDNYSSPQYWLGHIDASYRKFLEYAQDMEHIYEFIMLKEFDKMLSEKETFSIYYCKGRVLIRLKKYQEAIECFDKAILFSPDYLESYMSKGLIYVLNKQYTDASISYSAGLERPSVGEEYANRIVKYVSDYIEKSQNYETYFCRGLAYFKLGNYHSALLDFEKAVEFCSNNKKLTEYIEVAKQKLSQNIYIGEDVDSVKQLEKAKELIGEKSYQEALDILERLIGDNPLNLEAYYLRAEVKFAQDNYEGFKEDCYTAIKKADIMIKNDSLCVYAYYYRAYIRYELFWRVHLDILFSCKNFFKERDLIFSDYEKVIKLTPNNLDAYYYLAKAYIKSSRTKDAYKRLNQVIALGYNNADAYFERGNILVKDKKYKHALRDYDKALELDSNNEKILKAKEDVLTKIK